MIQIVSSIQQEVDETKKWIRQQVKAVKGELLSQVNTKWKLYENSVTVFDRELAEYKNMPDGEDKNAKRKKLHLLLDGRIRNLETLNNALGELDNGTLAEFDINLPVNAQNVPINKALIEAQSSSCFLERKKLQNQPIPVNEDSMEEELEYMSEKYKAFKTLETEFEKALKKYQQDFPNTALSIAPEDETTAKAQFEVKELGKKAMGLISNLTGRVKEVNKFADSDMLAESDTLIKEPRLLFNIQFDNKQFTSTFMSAIRDGKGATAVTVPIEKVKHRQDLRKYLKDEINISNLLPSDEIISEYEGIALASGFDHYLVVDFKQIILDADAYQKTVATGKIADKIAALRKRLYEIRNEIEIWLQEYQEEKAKGKLGSKDSTRLEGYNTTLKALLPVLQQNLVAVGSYEVLHDNYPKIISDFNKIHSDLGKANEAKKELLALQEHKTTGDNQEEFKDKAMAFAVSKGDLKKAIDKFIIVANDWCERHSEKDFGITLKREEVQDKTRDLILIANDLDISGIETSQFSALSDLVPESYDIKKDSTLKNIRSKLSTLEGLKDSTDYKKRFTKLGDLNELLQIWDFKHRHYRESLIKDAKKEYNEASEYFQHQYDIVNAMMSIKQLDKGMRSDHKEYAKLVKDYNESKGKEFRGDLPALLHGSNRLLEFISVWMQQYKKAAAAVKELKQDMPKTVEERKTWLEEIKDIIEKNNLGVISSMKDFDKAKGLEHDLGKITNQLESRKGDKMAVNNKYEQLKAALKQLQKAEPKDNSKILQVKDRLKQLRKSLRKIEKEIPALELEKKGLGQKLEAQQKALVEEDKGASTTFVRLMDLIQNRDSFEYKVGLTELEYSERWNSINYLLGLVADWRKKVIDPDLVNLVEYKNAINGVEADLLRQRQQFMENKVYEDKLYPRIETAYNVFVAEKKADLNNEKALHHVNYCLKLINYWFKENSIRIETEKAKRTQLSKWQKELNSEIRSDRFKTLKKEKAVQEKLEELNELLQTVRNDVDARYKEMMGNSIYNVNNPEGESALMDWIQNFTQIINEIADKKEKNAEKLLKEGKLDEAETEILKLLADLTNEYQNGQLKLSKVVKESEALVFAGLSDGDYDYKNSGSFSPEQIDLMTKTMSNAVSRATALMQAGASLSQIYESVAHLPSSMLPDEYIEQLNAFKVTEKAFKEEEHQQAVEEATQALGLSDILLDVDTTQQIATITGELANLSELSTFKKWSESDGEYKDLTTFSNEEQGQEHKNLGFALSFLDTVAGSLEDVLALKNLSPEERQKEVAEYLFKGGIDFEDEDGDISHATTANAKVIEISNRKRTIILTGLNFISRVSGLVDSGSDAFGGPAALTAATKSISFIVGKLSELIDKGSSPEEIARTTNQLWNDRIDTLSGLAEGLLATGSTIAQTVQLFAQLPAGLVPGLGIAANLLSLSLDIKGIAEKMVERHRTKALLQDAEIYDRKYVGPLKQEISSLNRRIAKQSVDVAITTLQLAGNITTIAGHPEAGAAIAIVAGVLQVGNKLVFEGINEAMLKDARDTLKKAQGGNRKAQIQIMEKSPLYAKMLIAVGCTNEPPDPIALEFVRQRGITEKDIRNAGTSKYIVRRFLRKKLLAHAEESDSHDGKLGIFKGLAAKWKAWRAQVNKKDGFWKGDGQNYKTLLEVYPGAKLQKLVDDSVIKLKNMPPDVMEMLEIEKVTDLQLYEDVLAIYKILTEQKLFVDTESKLKKRALEKEIEADKNDQEKDHEPIVLAMEQDLADLEIQLKELALLVAALELLESADIPLKV